MSTARFRSATHSVPGRQRSYNEDAVFAAPESGLWVVADGMGGHAAGDVASRLIVESIAALESAPELAVMADRVEDAVLAVNAELQRRCAGDERRLMGSTVIFLVARQGLMLCGWAGDSRAYLLRDGALRRISRDHSHVEELVALGEISPAEARVHPQSNIITRAVGGEDHLVLEYRLELLRPGDRYLLCSDGVDKELDDEQLAPLLVEADTTRCCEGVVTAADLAGGRDNISCLLVDVDGGEPDSGLDARLPGAQQALRGLCDDRFAQRIGFDNFRMRRMLMINELLDPATGAPLETQRMGAPRPAASSSTATLDDDRTPAPPGIAPIVPPVTATSRWWLIGMLVVLGLGAGLWLLA